LMEAETKFFNKPFASAIGPSLPVDRAAVQSGTQCSLRGDCRGHAIATMLFGIHQQDAPKRSKTCGGFASQKMALGSTWEAAQKKNPRR
jgi:hypothetical protein